MFTLREQRQDLYDAKKYEEDFSALLQAASQGDAEAQNYLGLMYRDGRGVPQNTSVAVEWFRKAAVQGDIAACFNLAWTYDDGDGVAQDFGKALKFYQRGADLGDAPCQFACGWFYANGCGTPQNTEMAVKYLQKAADQGDTDAQEWVEAMPLPSPPIPGSGSIRPLTSASMLWEEGRIMRHCVGNYAGVVRKGECYIYRMLEPARATVEIRPTGVRQTWKIHQIKSYCNADPTPDVFDAAQVWLDPYNQSLLRAYKALGSYRKYSKAQYLLPLDLLYVS